MRAADRRHNVLFSVYKEGSTKIDEATMLPTTPTATHTMISALMHDISNTQEGYTFASQDKQQYRMVCDLYPDLVYADFEKAWVEITHVRNSRLGKWDVATANTNKTFRVLGVSPSGDTNDRNVYLTMELLGNE